MFETIFTILCLNDPGLTITPMIINCTYTCEFQTKEYAQKKQASGGKLVDATKETEAALQEELDKVAQSYGGGAGVDMKAFPSLEHKDPVLDKE